ncbi:MAG TPA: SRPBCC domain-containing protein [Patescibacteria group bacterium]|nr:SRPBCC domain-containing protein [Patescibacteria group bacterium]
MESNTKELTLIRIFDAPRALVWKAWTDPKLLAEWWGPRGVTNPVCEFDATQGGKIHIVMLAGETLGDLTGARWPMKGEIQEITEPLRLVFTSRALRDGDEYPILETLCTVTFVEEGNKTKMTLHVVVTKATVEAEDPLKGMKMGWSQSLDKLGEFLAEQ